jgi:hypothetical protein
VNDNSRDLDQADEEILTAAVSDEALEAAAGLLKDEWSSLNDVPAGFRLARPPQLAASFISSV